MARPQFARGPRRKTQWFGFGNSAGAATIPQMVSLTAGTPAIISNGMVAGGTTGLIDDEGTITRMIGHVGALMNVATAVVQASFAIGLAVARQEAVTAGVASLPSPEDDPDFEWLYYSIGFLANSNDTTQSSPINGLHLPFDVRGQRIVRTGQTTVWLAESQENNVRVGVGGRYLVKLA